MAVREGTTSASSISVCLLRVAALVPLGPVVRLYERVPVLLGEVVWIRLLGAGLLLRWVAQFFRLEQELTLYLDSLFN